MSIILHRGLLQQSCHEERNVIARDPKFQLDRLKTRFRNSSILTDNIHDVLKNYMAELLSRDVKVKPLKF